MCWTRTYPKGFNGVKDTNDLVILFHTLNDATCSPQSNPSGSKYVTINDDNGVWQILYTSNKHCLFFVVWLHFKRML